jgi:hypothetical protein
MSIETHLRDFEARLAAAGLMVRRTGSNPVAFRLTSAGENVGKVNVWAPLNAKFNEVRDRWRDSVRACWIAAQEQSSPAAGDDGGHWPQVDQLLAYFAPNRHDFLDFEDLASAVIAALRRDRLPAPDLETLRYDFSAIERAATSRKANE